MVAVVIVAMLAAFAPAPPSTTAAPSSCHFRVVHGVHTADRECNPGAVSPAVTATNMFKPGGLCAPGYDTADVRPPSSYTNRVLRDQLREYGLPDRPKDYRLDHIVPLGVGGHPSSPRNFFPEPVAESYVKDALERHYRKLLCAGDVTLYQARGFFLRWTWARDR